MTLLNVLFLSFTINIICNSTGIPRSHVPTSILLYTKAREDAWKRVWSRADFTIADTYRDLQ